MGIGLLIENYPGNQVVDNKPVSLGKSKNVYYLEISVWEIPCNLIWYRGQIW